MGVPRPRPSASMNLLHLSFRVVSSDFENWTTHAHQGRRKNRPILYLVDPSRGYKTLTDEISPTMKHRSTTTTNRLGHHPGADIATRRACDAMLRFRKARSSRFARGARDPVSSAD